MDDSEPEAPSPAPLLADFEPTRPLGDGQSGPRDRADGFAEPLGPDGAPVDADARAVSPLAAAPEADAGPASNVEGRASDLLAPRPTDRSALGAWDALADRAAHYATRARGPGTRRTYRSAWTLFSAWCRSLGREP